MQKFLNEVLLLIISICGLNLIDAPHKYLSIWLKLSVLVKLSVSITALCESLFKAAPNKSYNWNLKEN